MSLNKMQIMEKIDDLRIGVENLPGHWKLNLEPESIYDNRQDCRWYGGTIGTIENEQYEINIFVNGDVRAWLYGDGEEIAYVKDRRNGGSFYHEMSGYIENDDKLHEIIDNFTGRDSTSAGLSLYIEDNNWIEFFVYDKINGEYVVDDFNCVIDITDDVLEAFENPMFYINYLEEQLGRAI